MDDIFSIIFFLWIAFAFLEGFGEKKKLPPSPSEQQDEESATFEIPTLANDPNITILPTVQTVQSESTIPKLPPPPISTPMIKSTSNDKSQSQSETKSNMKLNFTQEEALNAMILAEIFDKPKSLRKR